LGTKKKVKTGKKVKKRGEGATCIPGSEVINWQIGSKTQKTRREKITGCRQIPRSLGKRKESNVKVVPGDGFKKRWTPISLRATITSLSGGENT